jgi:hypothetical protein
MTHEKRLAELCSSAEGRQNYMEWLTSPITQAMQGAIRERGRPQRPSLVGVESAHLTLGEAIGYNGAADLFENPGRIEEQVGKPMEASYGAVALSDG